MIEDALGEFLRNIEGWRPPGPLSPRVCVGCVRSPYVAAVELDRWPHGIVHPFVRRLESVAQFESGRLRAAHEAELAAEYPDEDFLGAYEGESYAEFERRLDTYDRHARTLVLGDLASNREHIADALQFNLGARLDHYVGQSLASLLSQYRDSGADR